jgi:hypothetical protein
MKTSQTSIAASLLFSLSALPAWAAYGQIDTFSASALQVYAGATVDFTVGFTVITSGYTNGGSNPFEPEPMEGYQTWDINWYSTESETLTDIWLVTAGNYYSEVPPAAPNSSYSGSANFSTSFATPGTYTISATGGWNHNVDFYTSNESASRECYNIDPGGTDELQCTSWQYSYYDYGDFYTSGGNFADQTLTIEVLAVPEPATAVLWVLGLLGVAAARRRRR